MEFSRQEYWTGLPFPSPGDLPDTGSFLLSQFFASGGQSIGVPASASILPMSICSWFPWCSIKSHHLIKNVNVGPELCAPYQRHTNDKGLSALGLPGAHVFTGAEKTWHDSHTARGSAATPRMGVRGAATGRSGDNREQTEEMRPLFFPFQTKVEMPYFFQVSSRSCSREAFITNISSLVEQLTHGFPKHGQTSRCCPRIYSWPVLELHRSADTQYNKHIKYKIQGWSEANSIL